MYKQVKYVNQKHIEKKTQEKLANPSTTLGKARDQIWKEIRYGRNELRTTNISGDFNAELGNKDNITNKSNNKN